MPFKLVAQPVHGLRAPLHLLLRPALRAARRPALRRTLRALDPREDERRRGSPPGARAAIVEPRRGRARDGHRPVPAGRGALPPDARMSHRPGRELDAVLDRHPRPARRPRRRRAAGGRTEGGRRGLLLPPDPRRARLANDRAGHRAAYEPARGRAPVGRGRHRGRGRRSRRSSLGSPTRQSSSSRWRVPRGQPAHGRSGRASCTSAPASASTSSKRSRATGPRRSSATRRCSRRVRTCPRRSRPRFSTPSGSEARALPTPRRRSTRAPEPRQLELAI